MRILLISDIHFESPKCLSRHTDPDWYYRNQLINELGNRAADIGAFDAILIGGDIAFKGVADEYAEALRWIDELVAACGCTRSQVYVIPGNHDVDRERIKRSAAVRNAQGAVLGSPQNRRGREFTDQWTSPDTGRHLTEPLEAYNEFAKLFGCQIYAPDRLMWLQDIDLNDGVKLRLHGMTSALFCAAGIMQGREERPGDLYLDASQYVLAREPDVANLVFCHHPPNWFSDGREFEDAVNGRAAIHVFGHEHRRRHYPLPTSVRFACPAVTPPRNEQSWQPGFTVLELDVRGSGADRMLHVEAEILVWQENPDCYRPVRVENGTERLVQDIPLQARRIPKPALQAMPLSAATLPADTLSEDAMSLLKAASLDGSGSIMHRKFIGGETISSHGRTFTDGSARSVARWDSAKNELISKGLASTINNNMTRLTHAGYVLVDKYSKFQP